ncbi:MAG TPA: sensor histidine kinase, partial [Nitrososphaera sp.]
MLDRTLRKDVVAIVIIIATSLAASSITVFIGTSQSIQLQEQQILRLKEDAAETLAGRFELRIEDAIKVLQIAGRSESFESLSSIDKVSDQYKGIPVTEELAKRRIADNVLSEYKNFETVAFVLPNGDVYFVEPYQNQANLPRINFADREWYQGALQTGQAYAADPISSAATGNKVVPIAVPVKSEEDGHLLGIIVAGLNLQTFRQQLLQEMDLDNNNRIIYVDDAGNTIEDINETDLRDNANIATQTSVSKFSSLEEVLAGKKGNLIEQVDGKELVEVYHPITIGTEKWGIILVQPTKDAFYALDPLWYQAYAMLAIIAAISAVSGYLLVRSRVNSALAKQLATANAELVKKDKLKDEFLKVASHELRTPIQPIIGYSSLGARGLIKDNEAWKVVYKEAQRLMKLANNIVDISMAQSGLLTYNMEKTLVIDIVRSTVESFRQTAEEKKLSLDLKVDAKFERIEIDADASRLKGVFTEMLENAIKFTSNGGVRVECMTESESFIVRFSDTGTAIPDEILPQLFQTFTTKSAGDPTIQGAGLGLFICKAIVNAHGGS